MIDEIRSRLIKHNLTFLDIQTKQEEQKTLLVYSPDVGVSNKKEMNICEANLENKGKQILIVNQEKCNKCKKNRFFS